MNATKRIRKLYRRRRLRFRHAVNTIIHRFIKFCHEEGQVMNADTIGVLNIAKKDKKIIPDPSWRDRDNGVLAHPLLLRVSHLPSETRIFGFSRGECQASSPNISLNSISALALFSRHLT